MNMPIDMRGTAAVITGGGRGLGLAIARDLAAQGAGIALLDVLAEVADTAAALATDFGVPAVGIICDVRDAGAVEAAFGTAEGHLGVATTLVTAAGITIWGESADVTPDDWQRVLDINLNGTFFACQSFARRVHAAQTALPELLGSVILISSMSARIVNIPQFQASYHASKAAVSMLAKSLGVEWAPTGIRVNAVEPGYMLSDMTREFMDANPELAGQWRSLIPAGRMGQPADLVGLVRFLASAESGYLTAQSIVLDGGYTAI